MDHHSNHPLELSGWLPALELPYGIVLPTYYIVISLTFCICLLWLVRRTERFGLRRDTALDLALAVMIGGFLGARLFHIVFEAPNVYIKDPVQIIRIWEGGFVWYGGALAGAGFGLGLAFLRRLAIGVWLDVFAPIAAAGYAMGRVACLLTGCCFGAVCQVQSGWFSGLSFRYPTQLFAVFWEACIALFLLWLEERSRARRSVDRPGFLRVPGELFLLWLVLHAIGRLVMESLRADDRGPMIIGLSVSTLISLLLLSVSLFFLRNLNRLASKRGNDLKN